MVIPEQERLGRILKPAITRGNHVETRRVPHRCLSARWTRPSASQPSSSSATMKSFALLLALASLAVSATAHVDNAQIPLAQEQLVSYPGFDLDLSEPRIIELDDNTRRVVTELEKVRLQLFFES